MERNKRILVVDDQQDLREQLAKLLQRSNQKDETVSLVQQMRAKLLGRKSEEEDIPQDEENVLEASSADEAYVVTTAGQGEEAFEFVQKANENDEPFAVMFLDMRMPPGWDGLKTAKKIREIDKNIEIVIMTAYADHDQKEIARTVGHPEKLLYIKKPFQTEEIFQLALSLTTKWSLEKTELSRKDWLETLLRCMSKIKSVISMKRGDVYKTALNSILTFTDAKVGCIAVWSEALQQWRVECHEGVERGELEKFIEENSSHLYESRTTQNLNGKYLLPLKRGKYSAIIVIYDLLTKNDPEWYKFLSLLVMTTSEVLSNSALSEANLKQERISAVGNAASRISHESKNYLSNILSYATVLSESVEKDEKFAKPIDGIVKTTELLLRQMENILVFSNEDSALNISELEFHTYLINIADMNQELAQAKQLQCSINVAGAEGLQIEADQDLLQSVFTNLISNSIKEITSLERKDLKIDIEVSEEGECISIAYQDDGPGVANEIKNDLFTPFASHGQVGFGLGMPIARQIMRKHNGDLIYDDKFDKGARFVIKLPKKQIEAEPSA